MAFFLLDEHIQPFDKHTASLHAPLEQLFHIGCIKWATFGEQGLISRLNRQQQTLQPAVYLHSLTTLSVYPALTWIPQIGSTR